MGSIKLLAVIWSSNLTARTFSITFDKNGRLHTGKCFDRVGKPIIRENYVEEFFMKNRLHYRKHHEMKTGRSSNQLVVSKGLQQQVMSGNHESV